MIAVKRFAKIVSLGGDGGGRDSQTGGIFIYNLSFETEVCVYLFSETFKTRERFCKNVADDRCYGSADYFG